MLASEVEQVKKVANCRGVGWGIVADVNVVRRVWQVIAAAARDRRQAPVVFDARRSATGVSRLPTAVRLSTRMCSIDQLPSLGVPSPPPAALAHRA
jgi:hypothetical protein